MQCLPFLSETRREAFSMFPKRKKFQWFRILGMFSVLWHAQHTRVHRNSQKNESIHCNYICKKNFARGWLLRDFTLERVKDWWCVKDWSLTVCITFQRVVASGTGDQVWWSNSDYWRRLTAFRGIPCEAKIRLLLYTGVEDKKKYVHQD